MKTILVLALSAIVFFNACSEKTDTNLDNSTLQKSTAFMLPDISITQPETQRWYSGKQILKGQQTFEQICAGCHKKDASGAKNWKESNDAGVFAPPPLNGTAHAWHHPLNQLHSVIKEGTSDLGGNMPAWGRVLNDEKILETIAFFQSKWSDEVYQNWLERNK